MAGMEPLQSELLRNELDQCLHGTAASMQVLIVETWPLRTVLFSSGHPRSLKLRDWDAKKNRSTNFQLHL